jgi:hypothetical protein
MVRLQSRPVRRRVGRPGPPAAVQQRAGGAIRLQAQPRFSGRRQADRHPGFGGTGHGICPSLNNGPVLLAVTAVLSGDGRKVMFPGRPVLARTAGT